MDQDELFNEVKRLREQGRSIRAIGRELGTNKSRVERALRALTTVPPDLAAHPLTSAAASARPVSGLFVGRQREMTELKAALEDALSGRGRLVMLAGEPGIGKTRTARELAAHAELKGVRVLWGCCYEDTGVPPYWPWVQPLGSYIRQFAPNRLRSLMGTRAADIAEIAPELREKLPGLEPPPALEPEQARFRLFGSITTFLKNASQSQPLMLVLDDLHWADRSSLLLLQFLARQIEGSRILLVGCYRDVELSRHHPLAAILAQLSREPAFGRVLLRGLDREDTERLVEVITGITAPQRLVEAVHAHTEGNPFFIAEVVKLLSERGELTDAGIGGPPEIQIPEGVREVVRQRLDRLSERCNRVLTTASVIGLQFDFKLLRMVSEGINEEELLSSLDAALEARLIEEVPGRVDRYQFRHSLVQRTLTEELSTSRRVRLHARIGEALEELYVSGGPQPVAELAYHFAWAEPVLGPDKLVRYSLLAGEHALATYAHEEALDHFKRALAAKEGHLTDAEEAAIWFGLGRAQLAILERHEAHEAWLSLHRAFDYYAEAGDAARAVAVAECPVHIVGGRPSGWGQLLARALKLVPPDSHEAARLLSRYVPVLGCEEGDYQGAQEALGRTLTIAQLCGDAALEMRTLADAASVDYFHRRYQESLEKCLQAIELSHQADDPWAEFAAHYGAVLALRFIGDSEAAARHAASLLGPAERLRDRTLLSNAFLANELVLSLRGDWQVARAFSDRGLEIAPRDPRHLGYRVVLEYQVGDSAQGEVYLERLLEAMHLAPPEPTNEYAMPAEVISLVARITGQVDLLDVARSAAQTVLSSPHKTPIMADDARAGLALMAVQLGDTPTALEQYAALEPLRGTILPGGSLSSDRVLGLLAQTSGYLDQAAEYFEAALVFCRKGGYQPELAWTCYDYATLLGQGDDHKRASALLTEALSLATALGMRPLMEKVNSCRKRIEARPPNHPKYAAALTERQVQVLRLVAKGKTNREIAEELVLSDRTVQRHIANIYAKIAARNRAEATAFTLSHLAPGQ